MSNFQSERRSRSPGPSRLSVMSSNFRRGLIEQSEDTTSAKSGSLRELSDGPSIGKAPAPAKPPKPSAFRVKKAKALSISLLTGGSINATASSHASQDSNLSRIPSNDGSSASRWRSSRLFAPQSAALPPRLLSADGQSDSQGERPQSAMEHYRTHGPTKGLASPGWKGASSNEQGMHQNDSLTTSSASKAQVQSPSAQQSIKRQPSPAATSSFSDQHTDATRHEAGIHNRVRGSSLFSRSHSSLGVHQSEDSRLQSRSGLTSPSTSSVNNLDRLRPQDGRKSPQKYRATPSPLADSFNATSAPMTAAKAKPSPSHNGSTHMRTPSSSSGINGFVSSLPLPKVPSRNRAQSHATVSPTQSTRQLVSPTSPQSSGDSQPMLAPPRHRYAKTSLQDAGSGLRVQQENLPPRSSSPFGPASPLHAFGQQLGGLGVAVGKRGWDMMKSWNQASSSSMNTASSSQYSISKGTSINEATRIWNASPDPTSMIPVRGAGRDDMRSTEAGLIFGKSLRAAVVRTRLAGAIRTRSDEATRRLSVLDLGSEFSIDLPQLSLSDEGDRQVSVNRMEARNLYLPAIVVRCIEAIEKWGPSEEGIYRLSGRTSHTAKLKSIFDSPSKGTPLQLADIGPAELDLNSVCSVLKAYLRALPETMLTSDLSPLFNEAIKKACGQGVNNDELVKLGSNQQIKADEAKLAAIQSNNMSSQIANAIVPLMKKLPAVNWYLLREIAMHLGDMTREETVKQTKMPLSNLCLVLAPTLSLSVIVVRTFVEQREIIFGQSYPLPDQELDAALTSSRRGSNAATPGDHIDIARHVPAINTRTQKRMPDDWEAKRASIATVKAMDSFDKRISTSSTATVHHDKQGTPTTSMDLNNNNIRLPPALRMTCDLDASSRSTSASTSTSMKRSKSPEEMMEEVDAPPIAAHYIHIRKRSSSLANSMLSAHSNDYSPTNLSPHITKMPSSTSLYSIAAHGSTMDSSLPSSTDQDSPNTTDDDWPTSNSNRKLNASSSNTSVNSLKRSALDRPRPITPHASHFFSR